MKKEYSNSMLFSIISIVGSSIIIAIAILKQYVLTQTIVFASIVKTGDIYIICASMAITAIYNFHNFKDEISTSWPTIFFWISILNYSMSLIFYFLLSIAKNNIDTFLIWTAIIVFGINIVITYLSSYFQNIKTDVLLARHNQSLVLESNFSKIMEDN